MPLPFLLIPKALATSKAAMATLAEWNKLGPEQKALVREPATDVMRSLDELRRSLGSRLFQDAEAMSWQEGRDLALNPSTAFRLAVRIVDVVRDARRIEPDALVQAVGTVEPTDAVFAAALEIAEDDNYIRREGEAWVVTDFADRDLVASEHVVYLEGLIVSYIEDCGLAGRDTLAQAVGSPSFAAEEFQAALERALVAGSIHWVENGLYAIDLERLRTFVEVTEEEPTASPRELKAIIADVGASVQRLRHALKDSRRVQVAIAEGPPQRAAPPVAAAEDPLERLGKLKTLLDAGALTDEEFAQQKARLLEAL